MGVGKFSHKNELGKLAHFDTTYCTIYFYLIEDILYMAATLTMYVDEVFNTYWLLAESGIAASALHKNLS